jgi:uncharacterized protein (TIGR03437 family)
VGPVADTIVAGDFNSDGNLDIAVMNATGAENDTSSTIGLLFGKGNSTFTVPSIPVPHLRGIAVGDFNRDGKLDLGAATNTGVQIFLGHGDWTFGTSVVTPGAHGVDWLVPADFNGDKIPDLLVGTAYLLGNGDGTFQAPVQLKGPLVYFSLPVTGDFTGSGKTDIVTQFPIGFASYLNITQPQAAVTVASRASLAIGPVVAGYGFWERSSVRHNHRARRPAATHPARRNHRQCGGFIGHDTTGPIALRGSWAGQLPDPAGTSSGAALVTITTARLGSNLVHTAQAQIAPVAPSIFTLNADGLAAAYITRVRPGQPPVNEPLFTLQNGTPVARPIDLGPAGDQVYLILYGTGVRKAGTSGVTVDVQGLNTRVDYAGPQSQFAGFDQINALLPRALVNSGDVSIVLTASGIAANTVHVTIR